MVDRESVVDEGLAMSLDVQHVIRWLSDLLAATTLRLILLQQAWLRWQRAILTAGM